MIRCNQGAAAARQLDAPDVDVPLVVDVVEVEYGEEARIRATAAQVFANVDALEQRVQCSRRECFDVSVWPKRQREGHAFRAFVDLEDEVRRLDLSGIALHVFGRNKGAQALYAKLGFQPTNISLFKPVGPAGA